MDPSVIEEFENLFAFEDEDSNVLVANPDVLVADPDVKLLKELDVVDVVSCFVRESPSRFDNTVFTEDDILEDCVKLETDASSDEDATEEVTASDTDDDMSCVLLADKVTDEITEAGVAGGIEEDGTVDRLSDDNKTDDEIADDC